MAGDDAGRRERRDSPANGPPRATLGGVHFGFARPAVALVGPVEPIRPSSRSGLRYPFGRFFYVRLAETREFAP